MALLASLSLALISPGHAKAATQPRASYQFTSPVPNGVTLTLDKFVNNNGTLTAVVTATNTTVPAGTTGASQTVQLPIVDPNGSCQILNLVLGPLHLDLLGLVVDLNQVHLTITAQQGPGNLLGNLLCSVAGLLNGGLGGSGGLTGLSNLLNQLLGL